MRHEFALYSPQLSTACYDKKVGQALHLVDEQLWHRLKHVLRAPPDSVVYLFDRRCSVEATLSAFGTKNQLQFTIEAFVQPRILTPKIIILLPLLKRDALADALYSCVELGANQVHLVTTHKTQQAWTGARDRERCEKIMIAAAEQSKQFVLPLLSDPVPLQDALRINVPEESFRVHCDPQGAPLWDVIHQLRDQAPHTLVLSMGPEGDLTDQERMDLYTHQFVACALTPTVLRATQALVVALGAFRSSFLQSST